MNKVLLFLGIVGLSFACTSENLEEDFELCDTTEMRYSMDIVEIFSASCLGCHDAIRNESTGAGIDLSKYDVVKAYVDNGHLIATIEHDDNFSAMPMGASKIEQCNIDKIKSWINEGAQNN